MKKLSDVRGKNFRNIALYSAFKFASILRSHKL